MHFQLVNVIIRNGFKTVQVSQTIVRDDMLKSIVHPKFPYINRFVSHTSYISYNVNINTYNINKRKFNSNSNSISNMNIIDTYIDKNVLNYAYYSFAVIGGLAGVAVTMLYMYQDKLLYMPNPPGLPKTPDENPPGCISPNEWTINGNYCEAGVQCNPIPYEDVTITTDDGVKIHAWLLLKNPNVPTLLYFHGNAGNMGFRLQNCASIYGISGYNVLMMDYRGYGKSTGIPSEIGLQLDAKAVLKFVKQHPKLTNSPIIPFGRSLGGAVAFWLAYHHPDDVAGVIVENTFSSVPAMVDVLMPWAKNIKHFILRLSWDSLVLMPLIKQPVLFISGDMDELVPPKHMKALYDAGTNPSNVLFTVNGGTHNDTWAKAGRRYYEVCMGYIWVVYVGCI